MNKVSSKIRLENCIKSGNTFNSYHKQPNSTKGNPGGFVRVKLENFKSKYHTDSSGGCCAMSCRPCDYQFSIWITCDGKTTDSSCLYGWGKTGIFHGVSELSFTRDLRNSLQNPLLFNFTSFQVKLITMKNCSIYKRESWTNLGTWKIASLFDDEVRRIATATYIVQVIVDL